MAPQHRYIEEHPFEDAWSATADAPDGPAWFRDPLFSVGFALWALTLIVAFGPFVPADFRSLFSDLWADFVILPYMLLLALLNARRASTRAETQFWSLFGAALTSWLVVRVMYVAWPTGSWGIAEDVATDVLYGLFYLLLALALEMKPHEKPAESPLLERSGEGMPIVTTVIFFAATVLYFIILPARQDPEGYRFWLFSFGLYVALDLYLFGRVLALGHHREGRWRRVYTWLAALFIMWAMTDTVEGLLYAEMLPWIEPGSMYEIVWYVPGLAFLVALRTRWWNASDA